MAAVEAVIFDLGKVLVDFDWSLAIRRLAPHTPLSPECIEPTARSCGVIEAFETGKIDTETFCRQLASALQVDLPAAELTTIYSEIFIRRPAMEALFQEIKQMLPVAILSDTSPMHWQYIADFAPAIAQPNVLTVSYEVGVCKPDPAMYRTVVEALQVPAPACLFMDDRPENVEGARAQGLQAFVFTSPAEGIPQVRAHLDERI